MAQQTGGRSKAVIFLVLALAVATLASLAVYRVLQESKKQLEEAQKPPDTFPVVVATRDLYMGIPIGLEDVTVRELLPEMIPPEVTFSTTDEVVGRTPRERILSNEMIRTERLARRDAGIGLNALITPGKRAMSVVTGVTTNVAGFVRPGNFVDIMVSIAPGIEELETDFITETILQQVKVLASGSTLEREDDKNKGQQQAAANSLTVEVTLEEAEKLALAISKGTIFVVLRSDVDIVQQNVERPTDVGVLIGFDPTKDAPKPTPVVRRSSGTKPVAATPGAEVISGSKTDRVKFDANGTTKDN